MTPFLEDRKTSLSSLGPMLLTGVFIAVPLLMFIPRLIVSADYQSIDVGDSVVVLGSKSPGGTRNVITKISGEFVTIKTASGHIKRVPIVSVQEM